MTFPDFSTTKKLFVSLVTTLTVIGLLLWFNTAKADANDVRITKIQTAGESSRDDLFTLRNETDGEIDLTGWSFRRCSASGDSGENCTDKSGTTSIVTSDLNGVIISPDEEWEWINGSSSGKLSDNYSVALFDADDEIVAALTWGEPAFFFENSPVVPNPTSCEVILWNDDEESYEVTHQVRKECEPINYSGEVLHLSELLPDPADDATNNDSEFIELFNPNDFPVNLRGWSVKDASTSGVYVFEENKVIEAGKYFVIDEDDFSFALNNSGTETISLITPNNTVLETVSYTSAREGFSYARKDFESFEWAWTPVVTPEENNEFLTGKTYPDIIISEILPNPETTEEFIELYNPTSTDVSLKFWTLSDSSEKIFAFSDEIIAAKSFFVVSKDQFGFALNNSGGEFVKLTKPSGETASVIEYESAPKNVSYGWTGEKYRFSDTPTPGSENIFPKELKIKDIEVSKAYKDVYTTFDVETNYDDDEISVTWDFGDDSRSYKKETRHRYEEKDTFDASVTVKNDIESVTEEFDVKVRGFPKASVIITAIMPNPEGTDKEKEFVRLTNAGDKKISLEGWSIATGKDLNSLTNHPFKVDVSLPPGGSVDVTTPLSAISLNNSAGAIELRRPDKSVADTLRYDYFENGEAKAVPEDAIYELLGDNWFWKLTEEKKVPGTFSDDPIYQRALANTRALQEKTSKEMRHAKTSPMQKPLLHTFGKIFNDLFAKIFDFLRK